MIERLQQVLTRIEQLPPEVQEEAAAQLEILTEPFEGIQIEMPSVEHWEDPAGAWSDLPDDILEELDQLRHASPPTPPLEEL